MTISDSIKEWLYEYPNITVNQNIETDLLGAEANSLGIFKDSGGQDVQYIDGSQLLTRYYIFNAKQSSQIEKERISNQEFFEGLENWVHKKNLDKDYPILGDKEHCQKVKISTSFSLQEQQEADSVYQITIEITYLKER